MEELEPITIVVATNNFYAVLLSALLKSIEVNHKTKEKIHIHVIDDKISKKNIELLSETVSSKVFSFFWHKADDVIPNDVVIPNDPSALPRTTYLRVFAPYLIPKETKKMLYLDVDMIVLNDISILWNTNLEDRVIGAVQANCKTIGSSWGGIPNYKELGLNPKDKYFNAGLLLINPIKWRELDIAKKVIKTISDNIKSVIFADQYGLNIVFLNQWIEIDFRWNCYADLKYEDPFLIHYLNIKPIFTSYKSQPVYYDLFHSYLKQTPFKDFKVLGNYRLLLKKVFNKINKITGNFAITRRAKQA
jgi:lipopolysaccharide biosynthesis glycosyltransferase